MSVRPSDISQALLDLAPQVVHFSGHGTVDGALCFEDKLGKIHPIKPDALAALFEQFNMQVECVILNACYSESQTNAIAQHIDYVIGMNQAIGDNAAIAFSIGFYQAIGAGRSIEEAYKLGYVQIGLQNSGNHLTPVFIKNDKPKSFCIENSLEFASIKDSQIVKKIFFKDKLFRASRHQKQFNSTTSTVHRSRITR